MKENTSYLAYKKCTWQPETTSIVSEDGVWGPVRLPVWKRLRGGEGRALVGAGADGVMVPNCA